MDAKAGGPTTCTFDLAAGLNALGCRTDILTIAPGNRDSSSIQAPFIKTVPFDAKTPLQISRHCRHFLQQNQQYDLYHTNGLWMDINHATCAAARKFRKPCVVSSHGMLYPRALERSSWKKKLILFLGHRNDIASATCLHATCQKEMEFIRTFGYQGPIAVIPNPVAVPGYVTEIQRKNDRFRIGFLGRLHPYKNIDRLIKAWANAGDTVKGGELVLLGDGAPEYVSELKRLVHESHVKNVRFAGFLTGKEKFEALASLTALFLPSTSENFGMSVPEALLTKTPVMASLTTPWQELNTFRCGWWRTNDIESITQTIQEIASLTSGELQAMGERGQQLVLSRYSSKQVAHMTRQLYQYLLKKNTKPEFVYE